MPLGKPDGAVQPPGRPRVGERAHGTALRAAAPEQLPALPLPTAVPEVLNVICMAAGEVAAHYLQQGAHAGHRATPRSPLAQHPFPWFGGLV